MIPICGSDLHVPMTSDADHLFLYLLVGKDVSSGFCPFLTGLLGVLLLRCINFLYILDTNPLSVIQLTNIFPHSTSYLFTLFLLLCRKFLAFCSPTCFLFCSSVLGVISEKSLPRPTSRSFFPRFSSGSFMISGLTFNF